MHFTERKYLNFYKEFIQICINNELSSLIYVMPCCQFSVQSISKQVMIAALGINPSTPGQNGRHLADNIFRYIFEKEKIYILIKISLKFVP